MKSLQSMIYYKMSKDKNIDTIILGCTHYPLLLPLIRKHTPQGVNIVPQGQYIASSLKNYLLRHPEMAEKCTKNGSCNYLTTENSLIFDRSACRFMEHSVLSQHIELTEYNTICDY